MEERKLRMVPDGSFGILYHCSGCNVRRRFINTGRFRVNANGNRIDVWLIYQCEKCKHTKNLTIYERQSAKRISKEEYRKFLANDEALAERYGMDFGFLGQNRVMIDEETIRWHYEDGEGKSVALKEIDWIPGDRVFIDNEFGIRIRREKLAADLLGVSRSRVQCLMEQDMLEIQSTGKQICIILRNCLEKLRG